MGQGGGTKSMSDYNAPPAEHERRRTIQSLNEASRHDWTHVGVRPTLGIFPKGAQGPRHEPHFCR